MFEINTIRNSDHKQNKLFRGVVSSELFHILGCTGMCRYNRILSVVWEITKPQWLQQLNAALWSGAPCSLSPPVRVWSISESWDELRVWDNNCDILKIVKKYITSILLNLVHFMSLTITQLFQTYHKFQLLKLHGIVSNDDRI